MTFVPENPFEESLVRATTDAAHRPQFYQDLVDSDIFIIQPLADPTVVQSGVLAAGTELQIQPIDFNGKTCLPIFSSLTRLQAVIHEEVGYLCINALRFMEITRGADLILNPGSAYGKEFTAQEIERVLNGTLGQPTEVYRAEKDTQILVGQPKNYPDELVAALSRLFKSMEGIESAYLVHYYNPAQGDPPHTLIGICAAGDWREIVAQVGMVADGVKIPDPPLDFMQIEPAKGMANSVFKGYEPFYQRQK